MSVLQFMCELGARRKDASRHPYSKRFVQFPGVSERPQRKSGHASESFRHWPSREEERS
jgi:hypothetical protein